MSTYFRSIDKIASRLRNRPYGLGGDAATPLTARFPGLQQLFNSLATPSWTPRQHGERRREEWNPYSQRVLLPDEAAPAMSTLERDFNELRMHVQTFVEWSHEAVHVLILEPLFSGYRSITARDAFATWTLAGEGFAFWYADMVVTPGIRRFVPDAELVYDRSAVSNMVFHPEIVFRQLGITKRSDVLRLYLAAFLDRKNAIGTSTDVFPRQLAAQIKRFYDGVRLAVDGLHTVLMDWDFAGYAARFCTKGLPSLFGTRFLERSATANLEDYLVELGTKQLATLADLDPTRVKAVCLRRHLQTRAYAAWNVQQALAKRWIHPLTGTLDSAALDADLERYLARLENALELLAADAPLARITGELRAADRDYDRRVHATLRRHRAYTKYRYAIHPFFAPTHGVIGLAGGDAELDERGMTAVVESLVKQYDWSAAFRRPGESSLVALLDRFLGAVRAGKRTLLRSTYNQLVTHPELIALWAVGFDELQPSRNSFRELAFAFI